MFTMQIKDPRVRTPIELIGYTATPRGLTGIWSPYPVACDALDVKLGTRAVILSLNVFMR